MSYETPMFSISVAAGLAGMHPQTLRQYDRLGIVAPTRTSGRGRRYSACDVARLREVQRLSQDEGINLAGIKRIMELELKVAHLERELEVLRELAALRERARPGYRVFAADPFGEVEAVPRGRRPSRAATGALVVWRPPAR